MGYRRHFFQKMFDVSNEFFGMKNEEKLEFVDHSGDICNPIKFSNAFNPVDEKKDLISSRQSLRLIVNPDFHSPNKPLGFSEVALEFVGRTRVIGSELMKAVSESLGFEASYMHEQLNLDSGVEFFAMNYYPFLSWFDHLGGLVAHADPGVLTLLYDNGVPGLEVLCNEEWISMSGVPNALFVLNSDHLEIFSNGIYKRKLHRVVMKDDKRTRFTFARNFNPSIDTIVGPSPRLVDGDNGPPGYLPKKLGEYLDSLTKLARQGKNAFDEVQLPLAKVN